MPYVESTVKVLKNGKKYNHYHKYQFCSYTLILKEIMQVVFLYKSEERMNKCIFVPDRATFEYSYSVTSNLRKPTKRENSLSLRTNRAIYHAKEYEAVLKHDMFSSEQRYSGLVIHDNRKQSFGATDKLNGICTSEPGILSNRRIEGHTNRSWENNSSPLGVIRLVYYLLTALC